VARQPIVNDLEEESVAFEFGEKGACVSRVVGKGVLRQVCHLK